MFVIQYKCWFLFVVLFIFHHRFQNHGHFLVCLDNYDYWRFWQLQIPLDVEVYDTQSLFAARDYYYFKYEDIKGFF